MCECDLSNQLLVITIQINDSNSHPEEEPKEYGT